MNTFTSIVLSSIGTACGLAVEQRLRTKIKNGLCRWLVALLSSMAICVILALILKTL